jgi:hypothetical protein
MQRFLGGTRYLVVIPIIGLALAASAFFVVGGVRLIGLLFTTFVALLQGEATGASGESKPYRMTIHQTRQRLEAQNRRSERKC